MRVYISASHLQPSPHPSTHHPIPRLGREYRRGMPRRVIGIDAGGTKLLGGVVDVDGPPCQGACPNRGCLEALVSGPAIGREGEAAARARPDSALGRALAEGREITGALVTELAHDGDEAALEVLDRAGRLLGA